MEKWQYFLKEVAKKWQNAEKSVKTGKKWQKTDNKNDKNTFFQCNFTLINMYCVTIPLALIYSNLFNFQLVDTVYMSHLYYTGIIL